MELGSNVIQFGCTPQSVWESIEPYLDTAKNLIVMVESSDGISTTAFSDTIDAYALIGRLMSMINHIQEKQGELEWS